MAAEARAAASARKSLGGPGMSDPEFDRFRKLIRDITGISMSEAKRQLVERRISGRLKATGIESFAGYYDYVKDGRGSEIEFFCNAVTTNLTSFFRENHHFDYLAGTILPELQRKKGGGDRRLRIWSAGCSTGEEPYSLAITLRETLRDLNRWNAKILCTDLDSDVLATCRKGTYKEERVEGLNRARVDRWFTRSRSGHIDYVTVKPALQELTVFNQLNLMHEWPMRGRFDVIFCRNVVIYFDKPTQKVLMDRYANILEPDGYLVLGHSESLQNVSDRFELIGKTLYRRIR